MILYLLWLLGVLLVRRLPLRLSYGVAAAGADVAWLLLREKRRNTIENMRHVTGGRAPRRARSLARRSFENYAKYVVDFMRHPTVSFNDVAGRVEFDDW